MRPNFLIAYIMRGLPGSGKSTIAAQLAPENNIFSTDDYFLDEDGVYRFDPKKLGTNHAKNKAAFSDACQAGLTPIVCDNTNTREWEFGDYEAEARSFGYTVVEVIVGDPTDPSHQQDCFKRNTHGVPLDAIQRMGARFDR